MSRARARQARTAETAGGASDEELARRASSGQHEAFEVLLGRHQERVYSLVRRLTRNRHDAEEAVQETFLTVLRRLGTFRGEARFSTWLYRVAANTALQLRRRHARGMVAPLQRYLPAFDRDGGHAGPIEAAPAGHAEERLDRRRLTVLASRALELLDERYRIPFVLRDLEEIGTAEVAKILRISESLVRQRVHRARLMLRGYLARGSRIQRGGGR